LFFCEIVYNKGIFTLQTLLWGKMITKITYAGHAAVFLESEDAVIAIDPWLEGNPICPKDLHNPKKLDLILLTHGHSDHAGDTLRLVKQYKCQVVAVFELSCLLAKAGLPQDRIIGMGKGGSITWRNFKINLTNAIHSSSYTISGHTEYAGEACGVIINDGSRTFYHAGDTALFSDMKLIREEYSPDIAFLPIGDHFTMGPDSAAKAAQFCGAKTVIPIHYGTFPALSGRVEDFKAACKKLELTVVVPEIGKTFTI
jgi:L-ascorbate metabolism protein UlaG (beta-lactamase superfamily)